MQVEIHSSGAESETIQERNQELFRGVGGSTKDGTLSVQNWRSWTPNQFFLKISAKGGRGLATSITPFSRLNPPLKSEYTHAFIVPIYNRYLARHREIL